MVRQHDRSAVRRRISRRWAAALLAALTCSAAVPAAATSAQAPATSTASSSCTPRWRQVHQGGAGAGSFFVDPQGVSVLPSGAARIDEGINGGRAVLRSVPGGRVEQGTPLPHNPLTSSSGYFGGISSFDSDRDGWASFVRVDQQFDAWDSFPVELFRFHGDRWTQVAPAPPADPRVQADIQIQQIAAVSADDAWAAGYWRSGKGIDGAAMQHWDGRQWNRADIPFQTGGAVLWDVVAHTAHDVFAAGGYTDADGIARPLLLHYDGRRWRRMSVPSALGAVLYGVSADRVDDVWVSGSQTGSDAAHGLIEHWDGHGWTVFAGAADAQTTNVSHLYAAAPDDVWALQEAVEPVAATHFLHWDGRQWTKVQYPGALIGFGEEYSNWDIDGSGPDNVWAVASLLESQNVKNDPVLMHLSC